jgi:hypothetical protein
VIARALYIYIFDQGLCLEIVLLAIEKREGNTDLVESLTEDMKEMNLFKDNDCFLDYSKMNEENFFLFEKNLFAFVCFQQLMTSIAIIYIHKTEVKELSNSM